mmetsp:Transcript_27058/g.69626  ORF Transcript_27058/g.69626 Transcript_27058/m.69626 type:complete len:99 (-) Transcript_27058:28-324(-)
MLKMQNAPLVLWLLLGRVSTASQSGHTNKSEKRPCVSCKLSCELDTLQIDALYWLEYLALSFTIHEQSNVSMKGYEENFVPLSSLNFGQERRTYVGVV